MCFGGPSIPSVSAPPVANPADPTVTAALDAERRRRAALGGRQSTILTGGANPAATATTTPKTLLGA